MLVDEIRRWGDVTFGAPASADAIQACEAQLGHRLPEHLRQLLAETNGIEGEYELACFGARSGSLAITPTSGTALTSGNPSCRSPD